MNQRALSVLLVLVPLVVFPFEGACLHDSSGQTEDSGSDAGGPPSSRASSGGGSSNAETEDATSGGEVGAPDGGVADAASEAGAGQGAANEAGADTGTPEGGREEAGADAGVHDAGADGPVVEAGLIDGAWADEASAEAGCVSLTVLNYEEWCAVTVNGGAAFEGDAETLCVPAGVEQLAATALPDFELGPAPWHDTAGDKGQGDPGTVTGSGQSAVDSTTVVVGDAATCVWVCCPFDDGVGCPTTDQCP
jgi:hypothetical protein